MTRDAFLALLVGAVVGGGLLLLVVAVRGTTVKPPKERGSSLSAMASNDNLVKLGLALAVGMLTLIATRWVVAAVAGALMMYFFGPSLRPRSGVGDLARIEALASWCESLRDTIAGAVGLEQAIPSSLTAAGPAIQGPLGLLVDRLRTRQPLPDALARFADDLDDPSADLVIAALILNARLRGPGLRDLLGALSTSAREELDMRRRVEAARRSTKRSVRIVVAVSLFTSLAITVLNRDFVREYDTAFGQVVLAVVMLIYAAGFLWLRRLATFSSTGRFLLGTKPAEQVSVG